MSNQSVRYLSVLATLLAVLLSRPGLAATGVRDPSGPQPIAETYFNMHILWGTTTLYWPQVRFHSWRVITGDTHWFSLEPERGVWKFGALDNAISRAEAKGAEVLFTLGYPARWAADRRHVEDWTRGHALAPDNLTDWEIYLRQVVGRYKGRIKYYELMNEPHFTEVDGRWRSKRDFPVATMVEMAQIASRVIKEVDPDAKLVSMSPSGMHDGVKRVDAFLRAGGGKYIDVLGFHFYAKGPENIPGLVNALRRVLRSNGYAHLPIWNTESGFYIDGPDKPHGKATRPPHHPLYSPELGAAVVSRALTLGAASGLKRFYWYSWDIPTMALAYGRGRDINLAGRAYIKTERWLRGATINDCRTADDKLWICSLSRGTRQARLVWNTTGPLEWEVPAQWQVRQFEQLLGQSRSVTSLGTLHVNESPTLIVSDEQAWGAP